MTSVPLGIECCKRLALNRHSACLTVVIVSLTSIAIHWVPCPSLRVSQLSETKEIQFGGADPARFIKQAQWLFERRGFMYPENVACTALPPGYPLFLSVMMLVSDKLFTLQLLQAGFRTFALLALWRRLRQIQPSFAMISTVLLASSATLARQASTLMSECFGFCLLAFLAIQLLDLVQHGCRSSMRACVIGFLLAAVCFTSPFLVFPAAFAFVAASIVLLRSRLVHFCAVVCGASVPYMMWQAHCVWTSGHPIPEIYRGGAKWEQVWIRSWARSPDEYVDGVRVFLWRMPDPDWSKVPAHAWSDERMRRKIMDAVEACAASGNQKDSAEAVRLDELLAEAGRNAKNNSVFNYYAGLPVLRALRSWGDLPEIWYNYFFDFGLTERLSFIVFREEVTEFGVVKAALRQLRALASSIVLLYLKCSFPLIMHLLLTGFCVVCVLSALRNPCLPGVAVLGGVLVFSLFHAYSSPEIRRIAPVYPLVVFLGATGILVRDSGSVAKT